MDSGKGETVEMHTSVLSAEKPALGITKEVYRALVVHSYKALLQREMPCVYQTDFLCLFSEFPYRSCQHSSIALYKGPILWE